MGVVCLFRNVLNSIKTCFRFVYNHFIILGGLLLMFLIYRFVPFVFNLASSVLISSAPILVCTLVLLQVLFNFRRTDAAQDDERKRAQTSHTSSSSTKARGLEDAAILERELKISGMNKRTFSKEKAKSDVTGGVRASGSKERRVAFSSTLDDGFINRRVTNEEPNELRGVLKTSSDIKEKSSKIGKDVDPMNKETNDKGEHPEYNAYIYSDCVECSSTENAGEMLPVLDEIDPLLDTKPLQPPLKNLDESDGASISSDRSSEGSADSDNREEAMGGEKDKIKAVVSWTEDDQKNLMNLGTSELERNQRLENLIARRRARKIGKMPEKNLIDFDTNDIPPLIPLSTTKSNPFESPNYYSSELDGLPPIPGSAPSILVPRKNPFDLPYDPLEERLDLTGDSFQQEYLSALQKDMFFCRHESFSWGHLGNAFMAGVEQDKPNNRAFIGGMEQDRRNNTAFMGGVEQDKPNNRAFTGGMEQDRQNNRAFMGGVEQDRPNNRPGPYFEGIVPERPVYSRFHVQLAEKISSKLDTVLESATSSPTAGPDHNDKADGRIHSRFHDGLGENNDSKMESVPESVLAPPVTSQELGKELEEGAYPEFHRELSQKSDSKLESAPTSQLFSTLGDQEHSKKPIEHEAIQRTISSSSNSVKPAEVVQLGHGLKLHEDGEEEDEGTEGVTSESDSSDQVDLVEDREEEKREVKLGNGGREGLSLPETHHSSMKPDVVEDQYGELSSTSSSGTDGEISYTSNEESHSKDVIHTKGDSSKQSSSTLHPSLTVKLSDYKNGVAEAMHDDHPKEPVYDSSPSAIEKRAIETFIYVDKGVVLTASSSIASDMHVEVSEAGSPREVAERSLLHPAGEASFRSAFAPDDDDNDDYGERSADISKEIERYNVKVGVSDQGNTISTPGRPEQILMDSNPALSAEMASVQEISMDKVPPSDFKVADATPCPPKNSEEKLMFQPSDGNHHQEPKGATGEANINIKNASDPIVEDRDKDHQKSSETVNGDNKKTVASEFLISQLEPIETRSMKVNGIQETKDSDMKAQVSEESHVGKKDTEKSIEKYIDHESRQNEQQPKDIEVESVKQ